MTTAFLPSRDLDNEDTTYRPGRPVGAPTEYRGPRVKLFVPDEPMACESAELRELWFSKSVSGRERARLSCEACPFRGRCSYNAVAVRATHGIWGGVELPGDRARRLTPVYERLLRQFEERRSAEVGQAPVEPLAADEHFLRRRDSAA